MTLLVSCQNSSGAEYYADPLLLSQLVLDDNIRLARDDIEPVIGNVTDLKLVSGINDGDKYLRFSPRLRLARYNEETGREANDIILDLESGYSFSETLSLRVDGRYGNEVINQPEVNVTELTFQEITRETLSASPSISWVPDSRTQLRFSYSIQEVSYDGGQNFGLSSFNYDQIALSGTYALTEKLSLTANVYRSEFSLLDVDSSTITYAGQGGFDYTFNETTSFSLSAGYLQSESEFQIPTLTGFIDGEETATGSLINIGFRKAFETMNFNFNFNRNVTPGIRGDQVVRDTLDAELNKQFTPKLSGVLDYTQFENTSQNSFSTFNNNFEFLRIRSFLSYKMTRKLRFDGGYIYREIEDDINPGARDSNSLFFRLVYNFDKYSISR